MSADTTLRGCFLDAGSLGDDLDFARLQATADHWDWHDSTRADDTAARITQADTVITNKVAIDADAIAASERLRLICIAATGTDNVDLAAAQARGIAVCNARGYATAAVVQHVFALLLALATSLPGYRDDVRQGRWQRSTHFCPLTHPITELAGRKLGIIGYGELGRAVATAAPAFGLEVLIGARPGSATIPAGRTRLDTLLRTADAISLHCPLTPTTQDLIGNDALHRMKPSAFLINTARGGIVNEVALAQALRWGVIAGAGVDVLSAEPPVAGNPLLAPDLPNLILTPHTAWASRAARQRLVDQLADNITAHSTGRPRNLVSAPAT